MSTHADTPDAAGPATIAGTAAAIVQDAARQHTIPVHSVRIAIPRPASIAFYAAVAALAAFEVLDWPIATIVALGHALSHQNHADALREFGEGLEAV
jgi:hypothetical protein